MNYPLWGKKKGLFLSMERISGDVIALNGVQETFLASLRDEQSHCRICN